MTQELEIRGWPALVLVVLVIGAVLAYAFLVSGRLTGRERRAIIAELRDEHRGDLETAVAGLENNPDERAARQAVAAANRYLENIELTDVTVPPRGFRGLFSGKKARIVYTRGGKKPAGDGGVRYFRIRSDADGGMYHVYEISRQEYESRW